MEQKKLLAARIEDMLINRGNVLPCIEVDEKVEQLARHFIREILQKGRYDVKSGSIPGTGTHDRVFHKREFRH